MNLGQEYADKSYDVGDVNHQGLCPDSWHVPSDKEWTALVNFAGGAGTAGKKLKSQIGWSENANGNDSLGFSALSGGYYFNATGSYIGFYSEGQQSTWWSTAEGEEESDWGPIWALTWGMSSNGPGDWEVQSPSLGSIKTSSYYLRCVKN
jgi:uncharacterized protein (TIGR02145 family)